MKAAILSIGDELALGTSLDTNSQWLARELAARAVRPVEHRTVTDDRPAIADAIRSLLGRCDVLLISGGLGPTEDDLTRFALNDVVAPDEPLTIDQDALDHLARCFGPRRRSMPESNLVQAQRPGPSRFLPNPRGTAMGIFVAHDGRRIYALPGPPHELQGMFREQVAPALEAGRGGEVLVIRMVHEFGLGESDAAARLGELTARDRHPQVGTTVSGAIVTAQVRAYGPEPEVSPLVEDTIERVSAAWSPYAFGRDDGSLAEAAGRLLGERRATLATAESCTGGWLGKLLVDVPGASGYYLGGWVTYANELKESCLGVTRQQLESDGAVSAPVARAMAIGAALRSSAEYALAITGTAGPEGATPDKPVGRVFVALATGGGAEARVRRFTFRGSRGAIRDRSAKAALQMLRFELLGVPAKTPLLWEDPS